MQIGRPLMSDSATADNFARAFTRKRTEFGSDPDFSPRLFPQDTEWEKSISTDSRKFAVATAP